MNHGLSGWVKQEAGWWTKEGAGGVCREGSSGWYFYPADVRYDVVQVHNQDGRFVSLERTMKRDGPFKSLKEAIAHANQEVHDLPEGDAMA